MLLTEIFDRILIDSGAFLLGPTSVEVDIPKFEILIKRVLGVYNKYMPADRKYTKIIGSLSHTFQDPEEIPRWISDIIPVNNPYLWQMQKNTTASEKIQFIWRYDKPTLYLPMGGTFDIHAVYDHKITTDANNQKEILTITDSDDLFFKILTGFFMVATGRSRRALTIQDIPVAMDASDLVAEGNTLIQEGMQTLTEVNNKFYLAYG